MNRIIQLTDPSGEPVYYNCAHIVSFWRTEKRIHTSLELSTGIKEFIKETPSEIWKFFNH